MKTNAATAWKEINRYIRNGRREMHLPPWMEDAETWPEITPLRFMELRKLMLHLNAVQCAALLRVHVSTVWRWEKGDFPIPFAAYMSLRLLLDVRFLPHQVKEWEGWQIINAGPDAGMLYDSQKSGEMFAPADLRTIRYVRGERDAWKRCAEEAEARAADLEAENTRLRQMFQAQGVTAELRKMQEQFDPLHEKLTAMIDSIATAEIIDYRPACDGRTQEKAA